MTQKTLDAYTHKIELTTAITGKRVARASRKAVQDLQGDIDSILHNWQSLGKFKTRQEALDYLRSYDVNDMKTVLESATRLKEPLRTEEIRRITAGAYKYRMTKARAVQETQRLASKRLIQDLDDVLDIALTRTARASAKDAVHDLGHGTKAEISFDLPNEKAIREVAKGTGVYDKIKLFSATEMQDVKELAVSGMLSGRSYADVAEDVAGVTGKEFYKARRLVRTTVAQASVDARKKTFQENGIEYYQIVCAHDERTCPICSQYDGKIFKLGEGPMPTFHPNCRCMITASLRFIGTNGHLQSDETDESGINNQNRKMHKKDWYKMAKKNVSAEKDIEVSLNQIKLKPEDSWEDSNKKISERMELQEKLREETMEHLISETDARKIGQKKVEKLENLLTESEIIEKIGGADRTNGSCVSVATAYIANKHGLDVRDFRGGDSTEFFAIYDKVPRMAKASGASILVNEESVTFEDAISVVEKLQEKLSSYEKYEYLMVTGAHASMIRNTEDGLQYLELQSSNPGWKPFSAEGDYDVKSNLYSRFGYEKLIEKGYKKTDVFLIGTLDIPFTETFKESENFERILKYLNTNENKEKKGYGGRIRRCRGAK